MLKRPSPWCSGLLAICLTVAALHAPPSALAETGASAQSHTHVAAASSGTGTTTTATTTGTGTTTTSTSTGTLPVSTGTGSTPAPGPAPAPAPTPVPPGPAQPVVRVALAQAQTSVRVTAAGGLYVVAEGAVHWLTPAGTTVQLTLVGSRIQVAGLAGQFLSPVRLVPSATETANAVKFGPRRYRGEIEVIVGPDTGKLTVLNAVNLEDYVQGVLPVEMTPSWPAEALKAQAVAVRSYARATTASGKHRETGFDLKSNTDDQAYGGLDSETPATNAAVAATRGQVITFKPSLDKPAQIVATYFFSSSGGHTEDVENVWGSYYGYLRGVPDFDNLPGNFRFSWRTTLTPDQVTEKMAARGHEVGTVESIKPDATVSKSGRPIKWYVTGLLNGQTRTVTLNGEGIRRALGLNSAPKQILFKLAGLVDGNREIGPKETVSVIGADRVVRQRQAQGTIILGSKLALVLDKTNVLGPKVEQAAGVEITGGGWGHGVGMSQWGAHGMALLGKNYKEILTHYYTGVQVETR